MYTIKSLPTLLLLVSCFELEISLKFDYMLAIFLSLPINLKITDIKSIYMYFRETDVNIRSVVSVAIPDTLPTLSCTLGIKYTCA